MYVYKDKNGYEYQNHYLEQRVGPYTVVWRNPNWFYPNGWSFIQREFIGLERELYFARIPEREWWQCPATEMIAEFNFWLDVNIIEDDIVSLKHVRQQACHEPEAEEP